MKPLKTTQGIFNRVYRHLLKQKKKSSMGGSCMYRGYDGMKCAIGCLITDKAYKQPNRHIERRGVTDPAVLDCLRGSGVQVEDGDRNILFDLQVVHDKSIPSRWPQKLRAVAKKYNLKVPNDL